MLGCFSHCILSINLRCNSTGSESCFCYGQGIARIWKFLLFTFQPQLHTVNPLYNDIRYNSKFHNNVNLVCTKFSGSCTFSIDIPILFFRKICFVYLLESPRRGDSNKYSNGMIYKKKCSKSIRC